MAAAGKKPEIARNAALHRTIPTSSYRASVTTSIGTIDLGAVTPNRGIGAGSAQDLAGKYVWLTAIGGDITLMRKPAGGTSPVAGEGFVLKSGTTEELFVDPDGEKRLEHIAGASVSLDVAWDNETVG
jgi:hypothetical protein